MKEPKDKSDLVRPGTYRHFKGGLYEVLGVATHSETLEKLVLYRHTDGAQSDDAYPELWVRPIAMFLETVHVNGADVRRFEPLSEEE